MNQWGRWRWALCSTYILTLEKPNVYLLFPNILRIIVAPKYYRIAIALIAFNKYNVLKDHNRKWRERYNHINNKYFNDNMVLLWIRIQGSKGHRYDRCQYHMDRSTKELYLTLRIGDHTEQKRRLSSSYEHFFFFFFFRISLKRCLQNKF